MSSMAFTSLLAFLVLCAVTVGANNYCSICEDHTMCKYPVKQFARSCRSVKASGVDAASQRVIVDTHNKLRSTVANGKENRGRPGPQPPASNMRALTWDDELAAIAQRWANQCDLDHDKCRNVQRFLVWQNIHMTFDFGGSQNYSPEWENVTNDWYNEVAKFNKSEVTKFMSSPGTRHYTQLVWAETSKIGCGYIAFTDGHTLTKYYVCNYGKSGNWFGVTVYKKGKASSMCTNGTSGNSQGLCQ